MLFYHGQKKRKIKSPQIFFSKILFEIFCKNALSTFFLYIRQFNDLEYLFYFVLII